MTGEYVLLAVIFGVLLGTVLAIGAFRFDRWASKGGI